MGITKLERRQRIKFRVRKKITGTAERPRLSIFRSNKELYAQLIDDVAGSTLLGLGSMGNKEAQKGPRLDQAVNLGQAFAEKAKEAGYGDVVFDRNGFLYHGRVKSFADAAREAGLKF